MKWGRGQKHDRKNNPMTASPSPRRSLLSSWFSKFKKPDRRLLDPERDEGGYRFVPRKIVDSPELPRYGGDEEFWRPSFGKDEEKFPPSVCRSCLSMIIEEEEEGAMKFDEMVSSIRRMRELERNFADIKLNVKERETEPNLRAPTRIKSRAITKPTEVSRRPPSGHDRPSPGDNCKLQRKSPHSARESKSPRSTRRRSRHIKVRSPRMNSIVNVRRSKKGRGSHHHDCDGGERDYERYALVKCSYDPQGDFRESMMEMITARGIGRTAAEMEELLACYLILNDQAYHDVIIKVFRQVWLELDRRGFWGDHDVVGKDQRKALSSGQD